MKNQQDIQYAVMCLQALDESAGQPMSPKEISRRQGVPFPVCVRLIHRLAEAGILEITGKEKVVLLRPIEDLTALELLQAVWSQQETSPAFEMWVGGSRGLATRMTLAAVAQAKLSGVAPSDNAQGVQS